MLRLLTVVFLSLLLSACASPQPITKSLVNEGVKVSFKKQNQIAVLTYSGKKISTLTNMPKGYNLDEHSITEINNTILFSYQFADHDSAAGRIIAFEKTTAKELWRKDIQSFNISFPIKNKNEVYISAVNLLMKTNLRTGKIIWEQKDFYKKFKLADLESVVKKDSQIIVNKKFVFSDTNGSFILELDKESE